MKWMPLMKSNACRSIQVKPDRFMTMAQYAWFNFDRELDHYDLADSMHMMCPPEERIDGLTLGGFVTNIIPKIPFPQQGTISEQWRKQVAQIKRLGKPFDFWYVFKEQKQPDGLGYQYGECQMGREEYEYMMKEVGHLFLGWELGEFDGLYGRDVVSYWQPEERPKTRREAHDRMMAWLRSMHERLYSNTKNLSGCTFPHYFNELPVRSLGAEIGQGLLNTQVYVSFLRGACRQYGLEFNLITSVFDRWGYKNYTANGELTLKNENGIFVRLGTPNHGHSIGLLQAMWVCGYFAGATIMGLDGGFYTDELKDEVRQLSPLGKSFLEFTEWSRDPCPRGKQVRPLALMLDYYAGWTPPRHLYSMEHRVVWHSIPYGPSDHGMDQAYNFFYPGYTDCSYYRDERGFITPTPFGDMADVLLSDASVEAMSTYPAIWLLSDESPEADFVERLKTYIENGGHLVVSGMPMVSIAKELFSMTVTSEKEQAIAAFDAETGDLVREAHYSVRKLEPDSSWHVFAKTEQGLPLIMRRAFGKGEITFLAADHGLTDLLTAPGLDQNRRLEYTPDPPFELLHSVKRYIGHVVQAKMPVEVVGKDVYYAVNRLDDGSHVLCVYNPGDEPWTGTVRSRRGSSRLTPIEGPWPGPEAVDGWSISLRGNTVAVLRVS